MFGMPKKDPNVQDYVRLNREDEAGPLSAKDEQRLADAGRRLPTAIRRELDDRLRRGTI